ncbi:MAG TPA: transglutaminase domain-containing protein [Streptosporangiaceae bacterium]
MASNSARAAGDRSDRERYARQSRVTDPGRFTSRVLEVPGSLTEMRTAARQLVFHYRAGGDFAANGVAPERVTEIDTRYAEDMLARIFELSDRPLTAERVARQRLVGCCRDFTVLFLAIARAHDVPARARVGFATYFVPGFFIDHVVAEVWDSAVQRWRLVDAELADDHVDPANGRRVDPEDLTPDQFVTGPAAWLACRSGRADPERYVVDPGLDIPATRGWPYVRHNVIHDLAALASHEMVLWDNWGWTEPDADLTPEQLVVLDELAAATSGSATAAQAESFYARDGLRVPARVMSYSPAHDAPLRVSIEA